MTKGETREAHGDITSTSCRGSITEESEDRVDNLVWVVEVQALADLGQDGLM